MKKVLVVCNHFAPENILGAIRPTKLAKYLQREGYDIFVLAEKVDYDVIDPTLERDARNLKVQYVKSPWYFSLLYKLYRKFETKINSRKSNFDPTTGVRSTGEHSLFKHVLGLFRLIANIGYVVDKFKQRMLARKAVKAFSHEYYDVVFTSYPNYFSLMFGLAYKKKFKDTKWIVDLRDPLWGESFTATTKAKVLTRRDKIFAHIVYDKCDYIVSVTNHMSDNIPDQYDAKKMTITSGFDKEDKQHIDEKKMEKLAFYFTGGLLGGKRDYSVLFQAIRELSEEGLLNLQNIDIIYTGHKHDYEMFMSQIKPYGLEMLVYYPHKRIPRQEALTLQSGSSILVMGDFDIQENPAGTRPGKTYEYMLAGKPVIAIICGSIKKSELSQVIKLCGMGFAYEDSNKLHDYPALKEYVLDQYKSVIKNGNVIYTPNQDELDRYDYKNLIKALGSIIADYN